MSIGVVSFCPAGMTEGRGKFVLLGPIDGNPATLAVFSDFSRDFQNSHIVARFEADRGGTLGSMGLRVLGGGKWELSGGGAELRLFDRSYAYGGFDAKRLAAVLLPGTVFDERRIAFGASRHPTPSTLSPK